MSSYELRRQAGTFVDLADLASVIGRPRQGQGQNQNTQAAKFPAKDDFDDAV